MFTKRVVSIWMYLLSADDEACDYNPFRGFLGSPDWGLTSDFPSSLEFFYLPLSDVMTGYDAYDWTIFDNYLADIASRNHHVVARFWLDYPGSATGVPQFIIDDGLTFNTYTEHGGGESPDYSNSNLQTAILNFIAALGAAYDGDERLAVIQLGLLGFWGEWHCYPHSDFEWDATFEESVLTAFDDNFDNVQLNVRYASTLTKPHLMGYHDDSFAYSTVNDTIGWFFYSEIQSANATLQYKKQMMGGELRPELQDSIFADNYTTGKYAQNFQVCVDTTHVSYLLNSAAFSSGGYSNATMIANALEGARAMGYKIVLYGVDLDIDTSYNLTVTLKLSNRGVAPFYYDLYAYYTLGNSYSYSFDGVSESLKTEGLKLGGRGKRLTNVVSLIDDLGLSVATIKEMASGGGTTYDLKVGLVCSRAYDANPVSFCNTDVESGIGTVDIYDVLSPTFLSPLFTPTTTELPGNEPTSATVRCTVGYGGMILLLFSVANAMAYFV